MRYKYRDYRTYEREGGYSSVVERSLCMREASGSNPDISITTSFFFPPSYFFFFFSSTYKLTLSSTQP